MAFPRQVHEDLLEPQRIGVHLRRNRPDKIDAKRQLLRQRSRPKHRCDFHRHLRDVAGNLFDGHFFSFDFADIENVVDEIHQMPGVAANHLQRIDPVGHGLHR